MPCIGYTNVHVRIMSMFFIQRSYGDGKRSGSEGSEEDDDYVPYVPVKIRKQQMVSLC